MNVYEIIILIILIIFLIYILSDGLYIENTPIIKNNHTYQTYSFIPTFLFTNYFNKQKIYPEI